MPQNLRPLPKWGHLKFNIDSTSNDNGNHNRNSSNKHEKSNNGSIAFADYARTCRVTAAQDERDDVWVGGQDVGSDAEA